MTAVVLLLIAVQWKRQQQATERSAVSAASAGSQPSSAVASPAGTASTDGAPVADGGDAAGADGDMPPGLTKMQQVAWKNRNKLNAVRLA